MNFIHTNIEALVTYVRREMLAQKEKILSDSLNDLIKDGVLTYEETEPVFVENTDPSDPLAGPKISLKQAVHLKFRGEEVLNEYREKVKVLEEKLATIRKALSEKETSA